MGFAVAVAYDQLYTARNSDLTLHISQLQENLLMLMSMTDRIAALGANLMPDNPLSQILDARRAQLGQMGKGIEIRLNTLRAEQAAVKAARESIQKMVSEEAKSFKTFATA